MNSITSESITSELNYFQTQLITDWIDSINDWIDLITDWINLITDWIDIITDKIIKKWLKS